MDPRSPDPTPDELCGIIGQLVGRIGDVRIGRTVLPDRGSLYETTNGLFFVPHRLEHVKVVRTAQTGWHLRGFLAASLRAPLGLFRSLPGQRAAARMEVAVDEHRLLSPRDSADLPALLMQNPGVFFLARRSVQDIRHTFWGWTISRRNSLVLRLKPIGDRMAFHERMAAFSVGIHEAVCP